MSIPTIVKDSQKLANFGSDHQAWQQRCHKEKIASLNYMKLKSQIPDYTALQDYLSQSKQGHQRNQSFTMPSFSLGSMVKTQQQAKDSQYEAKGQNGNETGSQKANRYLYQSFDEQSLQKVITGDTKKRRQRFNENLGQVVDDVRSSLGFTRNNNNWQIERQSMSSNLSRKDPEQYRPSTSNDLQSIKSIKLKKHSIQREVFGVEKKLDLIDAIKQGYYVFNQIYRGMDEMQLQKTYQSIKSIISESNKAPSEVSYMMYRKDDQKIEVDDLESVKGLSYASSIKSQYSSQLYIKELEVKLDAEKHVRI